MCVIKKTLWICMICIPILKDMEGYTFSSKKILMCQTQIQINKRGKSIAKKEWTVALKYKKK